MDPGRVSPIVGPSPKFSVTLVRRWEEGIIIEEVSGHNYGLSGVVSVNESLSVLKINNNRFKSIMSLSLSTSSERSVKRIVLNSLLPLTRNSHLLTTPHFLSCSSSVDSPFRSRVLVVLSDL